jgi:hypothetical protein
MGAASRTKGKAGEREIAALICDLRLAVLERVIRRMNRFGFGELGRLREEGARTALEAALMKRKRQYVREHPEMATDERTDRHPSTAT